MAIGLLFSPKAKLKENSPRSLVIEGGRFVPFHEYGAGYLFDITYELFLSFDVSHK